MKITKLALVGLISAVLSCGGLSTGLPTNAATPLEPKSETGAVRRITASVAMGQSGNQPYPIQLRAGYGVNLSFIPIGETVQKVWFDNPAFATLDVDGCLSGLGRECDSEGAQVLHLRRINPLNMPGLPKTNSTLLTVITRSAVGKRVYLFQVVAASSAADNRIYTVEVVPDAPSPSLATPLRSVIDAEVDFSRLRRGLMVARKQHLIAENSVLWNRLISFLAKVQAGQAVETAAQTSGISMQLVGKLQELGNRNSDDELTLEAPQTGNSPSNSIENNFGIQRTEVLVR